MKKTMKFKKSMRKLGGMALGISGAIMASGCGVRNSEEISVPVNELDLAMIEKMAKESSTALNPNANARFVGGESWKNYGGKYDSNVYNRIDITDLGMNCIYKITYVDREIKDNEFHWYHFDMDSVKKYSGFKLVTSSECARGVRRPEINEALRVQENQQESQQIKERDMNVFFTYFNAQIKSGIEQKDVNSTNGQGKPGFVLKEKSVGIVSKKYVVVDSWWGCQWSVKEDRWNGTMALQEVSPRSCENQLRQWVKSSDMKRNDVKS